MLLTVIEAGFCQPLSGDLVGVIAALKLQRQSDILDRVKGGHQLEILKNKPDVVATKASQGFFIKGGDFHIPQGDGAAGGFIEARE